MMSNKDTGYVNSLSTVKENLKKRNGQTMLRPKGRKKQIESGRGG